MLRIYISDMFSGDADADTSDHAWETPELTHLLLPAVLWGGHRYFHVSRFIYEDSGAAGKTAGD